MAITIDATAGSAASNSFVTEVEQIAYMATRLNASAWTTITGSTCTETEKAAMIEATRQLTLLHWEGDRVDTTQIQAWPRQWAVNRDDPNQDYFSTTVIPQRVKDATAELAFQFVKQGTDDLAAADPNAGIIESTVDVITTRWETSGSRPQGLNRFARIVQLVSPMLDSTSGVSVVRG